MENQELFSIAISATSAKELQKVAKENGIVLSDEKAASLYQNLQQRGEMSDEELGNVSGGCPGSDEPMHFVWSPENGCPKWERPYDSYETKRKCWFCKHGQEIGGHYYCNHPDHAHLDCIRY